MTTWQFSTKTQRYKDTKTGKFLSAEKLTQLLRTNNSQLSEALSGIADLIVSDKITVGEWEQQTATILKNLHIQSYLLGKGGKAALTQRDYGLIGQKLQVQYRYLRGLSTDLILGRLSEKQFRARTQLYVNKSSAMFHAGVFEAHKAAGFMFERRVQSALESCQSCINYAAVGWVAIGTLPNPSDRCECFSGCRCSKLYSREKPEDLVVRVKRGDRKLVGFLR